MYNCDGHTDHNILAHRSPSDTASCIDICKPCVSSVPICNEHEIKQEDSHTQSLMELVYEVQLSC